MARFQILPAETKFYDWFEKGSANLLETALLLQDLVVNYEQIDLKIVSITEKENRGDFIVHEITDLLAKTLITPLDPEDTRHLAHALDNAVDTIEQAAVQMSLYQVERPRALAMRMCDLIVRSAEEVHAAMPMLRDKRQFGIINKHAIEVNRLENEADTLYLQAIKELVADARHDWFEFTRWKEIYGELEDATDRCEDIADVLQAVVLKHG